MPRLVICIVPLLVAGCAGGAPRAPEPTPQMAETALQQGSPQIALQLADSVLVREPANRTALLTRAEALAALGQREQAAAAYDQVLQVSPREEAAMLGLGRYWLSNDAARAEAEFLAAVAAAPRDAAAQNDLGISRDLQGRHTDAQDAYRRALEDDPQLQAAQVNLALSLALGGRPKEGAAILQPMATSSGASKQMRHDYAAVLAIGGDREAAARILQTDLSPADVDTALRAFEEAAPVSR